MAVLILQTVRGSLSSRDSILVVRIIRSSAPSTAHSAMVRTLDPTLRLQSQSSERNCSLEDKSEFRTKLATIKSLLVLLWAEFDDYGDAL